MRHADTAMYKSKEISNNSWLIFENAMGEKEETYTRIRSALYEALAHNEFYIRYQPIIDLSKNKIVAAEALLRWESSVLGTISPDQMIPVAEESGQIIPLGYWILETVCQQIAEWQQHYSIDIPIAINVSTLQIKQKNFITQIKKILRRTQIKPELLIFEITESIFIDDSDFIQSQMSKLNKMNIHCSLDDFGTGYSSLSYVRTYPFKSLKIDKMFIQGINNSINDLNLVRSIINMSRSMSLDVIAEGVENEEQLKILRKLRCKFVQGWYFAKAMPGDQLMEYLQATTQVFKNPG